MDRQDAAQDRKQNVLAEALAELMESHSRTDKELEDATHKLREAIGLEERH